MIYSIFVVVYFWIDGKCFFKGIKKWSKLLIKQYNILIKCFLNASLQTISSTLFFEYTDMYGNKLFASKSNF